jgi:hypothetical protein
MSVHTAIPETLNCVIFLVRTTANVEKILNETVN